MPGSAPSRPPTTRWSEGTAVISRSKRKHAKSAQYREGGGRRRERDADHEHVEQVPAVLEECASLHDEARRDLHHENRDHQAIEHGEEGAVARHDAVARLEPKRDGVEHDERHDEALGARVLDDAAQPIQTVSPIPLPPVSARPRLACRRNMGKTRAEENEKPAAGGRGGLCQGLRATLDKSRKAVSHASEPRRSHG